MQIIDADAVLKFHFVKDFPPDNAPDLATLRLKNAGLFLVPMSADVL
jgi:hypothetical protein